MAWILGHATALILLYSIALAGWTADSVDAAQTQIVGSMLLSVGGSCDGKPRAVMGARPRRGFL